MTNSFSRSTILLYTRLGFERAALNEEQALVLNVDAVIVMLLRYFKMSSSNRLIAPLSRSRS
jgi:hypothetical protein